MADDRETRIDEVRRLTRAGLTAQQIADRVGCSKRQVGRDRRTLGIAPPWQQLTDEQVQRAEELLDDGASNLEVARTIGCDERTIRRRFPGRGWTKQQAAEHSALLSGRRYRRG